MRRSPKGFFCLAVAAALVTACSIVVPEGIPPPSGKFSGQTADHRPVEITIVETPQGFVGHGELDGKPLTLAFLATYRGRGVLHYDGTERPFEVELSFDGGILGLAGLEQSVELRRGGTPAELPAGVFAGRFRATGTQRLAGEVELAQVGNLIIGTGNLYGQSLALSAVVDAPRKFRGRAMFSDGSEAYVTGELTSGDHVLTLTGIGQPLKLRR